MGCDPCVLRGVLHGPPVSSEPPCPHRGPTQHTSEDKKALRTQGVHEARLRGHRGSIQHASEDTGVTPHPGPPRHWILIDFHRFFKILLHYVNGFSSISNEKYCKNHYFLNFHGFLFLKYISSEIDEIRSHNLIKSRKINKNIEVFSNLQKI